MAKIYGTRGADILIGTDFNDIIHGLGGNDRLYGLAGDDQLFGDEGNDILRGGLGTNVLNGGTGRDHAQYHTYIDLGLNHIVVDLQRGTAKGYSDSGAVIINDTLISIEVVKGSQGDDILSGSTRSETLLGGAGDDILTGLQGNDRLIGNSGNDTFHARFGSDIVKGGAGVDEVSYVRAVGGVDIALGLNGKWGRAIELDADGRETSRDALHSIENVIGTDFDDVFRGNELANIIQGGAGNDTIDYTASDGKVFVDLRAALQSRGHAEGDVLFSIENITGSRWGDTLIGDAQNNIINGGGGKDTIDGGDGRNILNGGDGADRIGYFYQRMSLNETNFSVWDGGAGEDTVDMSGAFRAVQIDLGGNWLFRYFTPNAGGWAYGDRIYNFEDAIGSDFSDILKGDNERNLLLGGDGGDALQGRGGDDRLYGQAQDDWLLGGSGQDYLHGGTGTDTVWYITYQDPAGVFVDLETGRGVERISPESSSSDLSSIALADTLVSIENISGSLHGDDLYGDSGRNSIWGLEGNDRLNGRGGDDKLEGGDGNDVFEFSDFFGDDIITDFLAGPGVGDVLDFSLFEDTVPDLALTLTENYAGDAVVTAGNDSGTWGSVSLTGVTVADLDLDDFDFAGKILGLG